MLDDLINKGKKLQWLSYLSLSAVVFIFLQGIDSSLLLIEALFRLQLVNPVNIKNHHIEYLDIYIEYQMKSIYKFFCIDRL